MGSEAAAGGYDIERPVLSVSFFRSVTPSPLPRGIMDRDRLFGSCLDFFQR